jgi:hypothetical protein
MASRLFLNACSFASRFIIGFVFLFSGLSKVSHPYEFLAAVYKYQMTGPAQTHLIAMLLPWVEVVLGICLLSGSLLGGSFLVTAFLGAMFVWAQASAIIRHVPVSCGCFGSLWSTDLINLSSVIRSSLVVLLGGLGYFAWLTAAAQGSNPAPAASSGAKEE